MTQKDSLKTLESIGIDEDPFGLLSVESRRDRASTDRNELRDAFEEISTFYETFKREPRSDQNSIVEFQLYCRLESIRGSPARVKELKEYDLYNLLKNAAVINPDICELISSDTFKLLDCETDDSIYDLKHVGASSRISPEYLSRRKVCADFRKYEGLFSVIHRDLKERKRTLSRYAIESLQPGTFHVLRGVLLYIESIDGSHQRCSFPSGGRERFDGRMRIIFENGTESDMLFRSLAKAMLSDGFGVSIPREDQMVPGPGISEEDVHLGYIYVLRSEAKEDWNRENLYKVGHTTTTVVERTKNAKHQSTYLFNDVSVVTTYKCLNVSSLEVENILHDFFESVRLEIETRDSSGTVFYPREWFKVRLDLLDEAISLFLEDKLNQYFFDPKTEQIIAR